MRGRIILINCSPKAGQGMNVSMQDTYNLGWKLGAVINGSADRAILKTYQSERRRIAQDLIDFDHRFSRLFSGRPAKDVMDEEGISMTEFKDAFVKGNMFASGLGEYPCARAILILRTDIGLAVDYGASLIVAKEGSTTEQGDGTDVSSSKAISTVSQESYASNVKLGMRMPSFKVLNQSDARPWHFQELLKSNGCWRIVIFTGDILAESQRSRIWALGEDLSAQDSFIRKYTPPGKSISSIIEVLAVHSAPRTEVDIFSFPPIFRPFSETSGFDYSKLFVDDESYHEGHGHAYEEYGIDPQEGCAIILRPDQYVGWMGAVDDHEMMARYFAGFMKERGDGGMQEEIDAGGALKRVDGGGPAADLAERDHRVLGAM